MPLHPQVKAFLEEAAAAGLPAYHTMQPAQAREAMLARAARFLENPPRVARLEEREIPGPSGTMKIRVYTPESTPPFPVLVYFHGGGWVQGSLESHDSMCRAMANASGFVVVSVDYRLAPEHKFPAQIDDACSATTWVAEHSSELRVDSARLAVGGDSAGGAMAAAVCLASRERGGPKIACQLLCYPVTDFAFDTTSYREFASGYSLTKADMEWFWNHYLADPADGKNPLASPLRASDLHGLPPAIVITAEYDPLRDEGEIFAHRLNEAGVPVWFKRYDGMIHNFVRMFPILDGGEEAIEDIGKELRRLVDERDASDPRHSGPEM